MAISKARNRVISHYLVTLGHLTIHVLPIGNGQTSESNPLPNPYTVGACVERLDSSYKGHPGMRTACLEIWDTSSCML